MLPARGSAIGAGELEAGPSPGTTKKRDGAPSRCSSWRIIFSAAAFTVKASIFLPMPVTSMRRLEPSIVQTPAPSNCAAERCSASTSAQPTAWRMASMLGRLVGAAAARGALASAPSVIDSPAAKPATGAAGKGVAPWNALTGAAVGRSIVATGEDAVPESIFADPHPPPAGPKGESGGGAAGAA